MKLRTLALAILLSAQTTLSFLQQFITLTTVRFSGKYFTVWSVTNYADAYWFLYSTKTMRFSYQER